ncbi:hypothetical protein [Paludibacterium sp.]|uniref:hypothetical protein n=1 Tax=Paludibacterium sp. TaxID=1917523 RepID=UPI0025E5EC7B|nr:hypothetical protein [Paludibacterium sp.]MBV8648610.1 hypothetical protein [Paludibacterium sp.]
MEKRHKWFWRAIGVATLSGVGYFWLAGPGAQWRPYQPIQYMPQKDKQDPSYLAYQAADELALIVGVEKQKDGQYGGRPDWQTPHDVLGIEAPQVQGRYRLLDYIRYEDDHDGTFNKGAVVFRMDTLGDHPVQILGVQPVRYDTERKRVVAASNPLLAVVSQPDGTIDYEDRGLTGPIATFGFGKSGTTPQGYQRTDAGLMVLTLTNHRLLPALHYTAALTPPGGQCEVGQATPCRKIVTAIASAEADAASAGLPVVILNSTLISQQTKQTRSYRLRYDHPRHTYLLFGDRGIDPIEALSPAKTDAFLATLPPQTERRPKS